MVGFFFTKRLSGLHLTLYIHCTCNKTSGETCGDPDRQWFLDREYITFASPVRRSGRGSGAVGARLRPRGREAPGARPA